MKLRNFYRVDKHGKIMQGSNIRVPRNPDNVYWKEFTGQKELCCDPDNIPELPEYKGILPRYFVRLDEHKNPVPGTLMISRTKNKPGHFDWQEIRIAPCCPEEVIPEEEGDEDEGDNEEDIEDPE